MSGGEGLVSRVLGCGCKDRTIYTPSPNFLSTFFRKNRLHTLNKLITKGFTLQNYYTQTYVISKIGSNPCFKKGEEKRKIKNQSISSITKNITDIKEKKIVKCLILLYPAEGLNEQGNIDDDGYVNNLDQLKKPLETIDETKKKEFLHNRAWQIWTDACRESGADGSSGACH